MTMSESILTRSVTIASGASLSNALSDLDGAALVGIVMPADWTAANLTFQTSDDDTNFGDLYDEVGTEIAVVVAAGRRIKLLPQDWLGWNGLKVRSGTTGTPVNQGAERVITFVLMSP